MDIRVQFPVLVEDREILDDAIARQGRLFPETAEQVMTGRVPVVMHLKSMRCVILHLLIPNVGGSPIYCYKYDSIDLVESVENVQ